MNAPSWLCRQEQTLRDHRREQNMTVRVVCSCLFRNVLLSEILATTPLDIDQSVRKLHSVIPSFLLQWLLYCLLGFCCRPHV